MASVDMEEDQEEEGDSDVEEHCGMEQPPLIKQLKSILAEYPDDGQIIKELAQNAEDAGASEMKILYDGRTLNQKMSKKFPYNKFFKAPALCFFNDSEFSENDWRGIKMIYSSVKEEDPLKVGRFGLGFKSVFHITDFPCILSGDRILFLNPHEDPRFVCTTIKLKNLEKCKNLQIDNVLKSISGLFGFTNKNLAAGHFMGTIFCFPLRTVQSDLSDNLYNWKKVHDLFRSYMSEATHSLLFLKSLSKVEMFCKHSDSELDLVGGIPFFKVEIEDDDGSVKQNRKKFTQEISSAEGTTSSSSKDIENTSRFVLTTRFVSKGSKEKLSHRSWIVVNVYCRGDMSTELRELVYDKSLSYSPYVGIAAPLDNFSDFRGHVFCFLPLPQEKNSLTGLPVHLNAFFALSQNRRHIKWASADQIENQTHRDKSIRWNECLLSEVFPKVYCRLVEEIIKISVENGNPAKQVDAVYRSLPDPEKVDPRWEILVKNLLSLVRKMKIIYTAKRGRSWCKYEEVLFTMFHGQAVSVPVKESVIKVISRYLDVPDAKIPQHVWSCIHSASPRPKDISPSELSKIFLKSPIYKEESNEAKIGLLEYILSAGDVEGVQNAFGLELLPLKDGTWTTFSPVDSNHHKVFVGTKEEMEIFPGMEHVFVSTILSSKEGLSKQLRISGECQIELLTEDSVATLLQKTIQVNYTPKRNKTEQHRDIGERIEDDKRETSDPLVLKECHLPWLQKVWKYLKYNFSEKLAKFADIHLFPCLVQRAQCKSKIIHLYKLDNTFLLSKITRTSRTEVPRDVCSALEALNIVIIPAFPEWFSPYLPLLSNVFYAQKSEVLQMLGSLGKKGMPSVGSWFNTNVTENQRESLVKYIGSADRDLFNSDCNSVLRELNIFHQKESGLGKVTFVSLNENKSITDQTNIPVRFHKKLIIPSSVEEKSLAERLGAETIPQFALIRDMLSLVLKGEYNQEEIKVFMEWLLINLKKFKENTEVLDVAREVPFLETTCELKKAQDLFDFKNEKLQTLFYGEDVFPFGDFACPQYHSGLRKLGLKDQTCIKPLDILHTAEKLSELVDKCTSHNKQKVLTKALAFLEYLKSNARILSTLIKGRELGNYLASLKCIMHKRERPSDFPQPLSWYGAESELSTPKEVKCLIFAQISGSVVPLVDLNESEKLSSYFRWNASPEIGAVVSQLRHVVLQYESRNKATFLPIICSIYSKLASLTTPDSLNRNAEMKELLQQDCIWWGDGFCTPLQMIVEHHEDNIPNLQPYLYNLPSELKDLKGLFQQLGCQEKQSTGVLLRVQKAIQKKYETKRKPKRTIKGRENKRDLEIVIAILHRISSMESEENLQRIRNEILFPLRTASGKDISLKPATLCTYCSEAWHEEGGNEDSDEEEINYVHESVPQRIAQTLGVKSRMAQMATDDVETEEWGQEEQLTTRLRNLLTEGYSDGFSIPKEILQNADDAEASELCLLYDERQNIDARTRLLDEGMKGCQGPALWAYNNSNFSESDFQNITKLSGATKQADDTKIGKFGLGFCSVYNLTDVPSFISGQNLVIFDPHKHYLGNALPGRRPGIKINIQNEKNKKKISRMDQLKPFQGVFGFDLAANFEGTLFRFPLRTQEQAHKSEISDLCYNRREMLELLAQFVKDAGNLLLFTQNVTSIKIFHQSEDQKQKYLMFECKKKIQSSETSTPAVLRKVSDLKKRNALTERPVKLNQMIEIAVTTKVYAEKVSKLFQRNRSLSYWVVSWASGTRSAAELCCKPEIKGAVPLGSVAAMVTYDKEHTLLPEHFKLSPPGFYKESHVFCFLPLPVTTKFAVHLNGCFAVSSDRKRLCTSTEDDKRKYDSQWNEALIEDAVVSAYIHLLEYLRDNNPSSNYAYSTLWPVERSHEVPGLLPSFYRTLAEQNYKIFCRDGLWAPLSECVFLDKQIRYDRNVGDIAFTVAKTFYSQENHVVMDVPENVWLLLDRELASSLNEKIITTEVLLSHFFLPNIANIFWKKRMADRNALLKYAISYNNANVNNIIMSTSCVPSHPYGRLRAPSDLVDRSSKIARLFCEEDERFPSEEFNTIEIQSRLKQLGMMTSNISCKLLINRAMSVKDMLRHCISCGLERCARILKYLSKNPDQTEKVGKNLACEQFLPVLERPKEFPTTFPWKANDLEHIRHQQGIRSCNKHLVIKSEYYSVIRLQSPTNLYFERCKYLASCKEYLLYESRLETALSGKKGYADQILSKLGVKGDNDLPLESILTQLCTVSKQNTSKELNTKMSRRIYDWLEKYLDSKEDSEEISALQTKPVICIGECFVEPKYVALQLACTCSPMLYGLSTAQPSITKYKNFLKAVGVKDQFSISDFIQALKSLKNACGMKRLQNEQVSVACSLLHCLSKKMEECKMSYGDLKEFWDDVVAPDVSRVLRPTYDLCFNDCDFVKPSSSMLFIHGRVAPEDARMMGVRSKSRKNFADNSLGMPFEQKEELVTRLSGILQEYPCDAGIMKELLQNADDAEATEVHFIKDGRTHPGDKIFDVSYKQLQGPALCVYNDKGFTQADLQGIQNLGKGSKSRDSTRTGQYGVGFNSVYNITDTPSFLTKGTEIEGGETLCLFDPSNIFLEDLHGTRIKCGENKGNYPDVFRAYHEKEFMQKKEGTMFRFPLRKKASDLSKHTVDDNKLEELLKMFETEIFDMLLFLKHVRKITISDITTGKLVRRYYVKLLLSKEDDEKRAKYFCHVKQFSKSLKEDPTNILKLGQKKNGCEVLVRDLLNTKRYFYLVQAVGVRSDPNVVPDSVLEAYKSQDLGLIPHGGVAVPIVYTIKNVRYGRRVYKDRETPKCRAYCVLPLPGNTGLPMHINGHFALDHEARRCLWREENARGYRWDWNHLLLKEIIAGAYCDALLYVKNDIFVKSQAEVDSMFVQHGLGVYHEYFPTLKNISDDYWKCLVQYVYGHIVEGEVPLFPVVKELEIPRSLDPVKKGSGTAHPRSRISWKPCERVDLNSMLISKTCLHNVP